MKNTQGEGSRASDWAIHDYAHRQFDVYIREGFLLPVGGGLRHSHTRWNTPFMVFFSSVEQVAVWWAVSFGFILLLKFFSVGSSLLGILYCLLEGGVVFWTSVCGQAWFVERWWPCHFHFLFSSLSSIGLTGFAGHEGWRGVWGHGRGTDELSWWDYMKRKGDISTAWWWACCVAAMLIQVLDRIVEIKMRMHSVFINSCPAYEQLKSRRRFPLDFNINNFLAIWEEISPEVYRYRTRIEKRFPKSHVRNCRAWIDEPTVYAWLSA